MKNGAYDITIEQYHSCEGFSRSQLVHFNKSPLHFWHEAISGHKEISKPVDIIKKTNALEFGNALHTAILEPSEFHKRYIAMPKVNRTTKAGKEAYEGFLEQAQGKQIICEETYEILAKMDESIKRNKDAYALITDAEYEKSIFWTDPDTGILCKVRPDIWQNNFICDLKTCQSASHRDFERAVYAYSYHIQAGMIQEALKHVFGIKMDNFIFVAIEKEAPYAVGVYRLDPVAISLGVTQFKNILQGIRKCQAEENWPSYPTAWITVPKWAQE